MRTVRVYKISSQSLPMIKAQDPLARVKELESETACPSKARPERYLKSRRLSIMGLRNSLKRIHKQEHIRNMAVIIN